METCLGFVHMFSYRYSNSKIKNIGFKESPCSVIIYLQRSESEYINRTKLHRGRNSKLFAFS